MRAVSDVHIRQRLIQRLEDMKVLEMRPEDIMVLKVPYEMNIQEIQPFVDEIKRLQEEGGLLHGRSILLIQNEIEVGLLRLTKPKVYDGDVDNGR